MLTRIVRRSKREFAFVRAKYECLLWNAFPGVFDGLVCLNGPPAIDPGMQRELFEQALDEPEHDPDTIDRVLEMTLEYAGLRIRRYSPPA